MTKDLSYLIGIIITILIGTFLYFTLCSDCRLAKAQEEIPHEETDAGKKFDPTSFPFAIEHEDFSFKSPNNFNFAHSSGNFELPVSLNVNTGIKQLKAYLLEHPDKSIDITGLYHSSEENTTAWPNLGLARANMVKNYFVGLGIPSAQTNTVGKLVEEMVPSENILLGPVNYALVDTTDNSDDLEELYKKITDDPLVLYFEKGEATLTLTTTQRAKVADIAKYLDKREGATCTVEGHTDNTGERASNINLGQERANFVKAFLVRNGIPEARVATISKGPDDPMASNTTEEGRRKNRRTVVTLN